MMAMRSYLKFGAALALVLGAASAAQATLITWTLKDVAFDDGGTAAGFFEYNPMAQTLGNFNIGVSGGDTSLFPSFTYTPTSAPLPAWDGAGLFFLFGTPEGRQIRFGVAAPLPATGGTVALDLTNMFASECYNCAPFRSFTGGSLVGGAVPEPESWAMLIIGFGLTGALLRRRQVVQAA